MGDENAFENVIISNVVSGGSVVNLCEGWGIPFKMVMTWLRFDKDRSDRYDKALVDRDEWAKEKILAELKAIATSDIRALFKDDGSLKPPTEWPPEIAKSVNSFDMTDYFEGNGRERQQVGFTKKVKLSDKLKAMELYGKKLALFKDHVEHSGQLTLADIVSASYNVGEPNEKESKS